MAVSTPVLGESAGAHLGPRALACLSARSPSPLPSQPAQALPMIGIGSACANIQQRALGINTIGSVAAPACASACVWWRSRSAAALSRRCTRQSPSACADCGLRWRAVACTRGQRRQGCRVRASEALAQPFSRRLRADPVGTCLHQPRRTLQRLLGRGPVAADWHINHNPGGLLAPRYRLSVMRHGLERHRHRRVEPVRDHAEHACDEQRVNAGTAEQAREVAS